MSQVNKNLISYFEKQIFPQYKHNEEGHGIEHIKTVLHRSVQIVEHHHLDININMLYTAVGYHDIGHHINPSIHEKISANLFTQDIYLQAFFTHKESQIIQQAIEDHRASLKKEPRNLYGKILSTADRDTSVPELFKRVYEYRLHHVPNASLTERIEEAYIHIQEKFWDTWYAKVYLKDEAYENFLVEVRTLLADKEAFTQTFKSLNNIK